MTNFETIKNMNVREMTGFLFTFALGFKNDLDEAHKKELWNSILKMLNTDVKKVGK